jgi:hypothetical protein
VARASTEARSRWGSRVVSLPPTGSICCVCPFETGPLSNFCIEVAPGLQIQSNALAALEAIDADMAEEVMSFGCITGDRVNGLCDGLTGDWCATERTYL